jgi:hypothetical protein
VVVVVVAVVIVTIILIAVLSTAAGRTPAQALILRLVVASCIRPQKTVAVLGGRREPGAPTCKNIQEYTRIYKNKNIKKPAVL